MNKNYQILFSGFMILVFVCAIGTLLLCGGFRTYYVYQFGRGDNEILVDAEVLKEINPQAKMSLK